MLKVETGFISKMWHSFPQKVVQTFKQHSEVRHVRKLINREAKYDSYTIRDLVYEGELEKAIKFFNDKTGLSLKIPNSVGILDLVRYTLKAVEKSQKNHTFSPKIKHVVISCGNGTLAEGTWHFKHDFNSVPEYLSRTIPKNEEALLIVCETGHKNRKFPAIGYHVTSTLKKSSCPGKIYVNRPDGTGAIIGQQLLRGATYY